jgi:hypothetical protein
LPLLLLLLPLLLPCQHLPAAAAAVVGRLLVVMGNLEGVLQVFCPLVHCRCQSCLSHNLQQQQQLARPPVHPAASGPCSAPHSSTTPRPCLLLLLLLQELLLLLRLLGMLQLLPLLLLLLPSESPLVQCAA